MKENHTMQGYALNKLNILNTHLKERQITMEELIQIIYQKDSQRDQLANCFKQLYQIAYLQMQKVDECKDIVGSEAKKLHSPYLKSMVGMFCNRIESTLKVKNNIIEKGYLDLLSEDERWNVPDNSKQARHKILNFVEIVSTIFRYSDSMIKEMLDVLVNAHKYVNGYIREHQLELDQQRKNRFTISDILKFTNNLMKLTSDKNAKEKMSEAYNITINELKELEE